ncbi:GNAT family N-acetyltransferase [Vibrio sp. HN007]|uniref:GNAT family N-acetyltransferase n=1 Tax=Vibrio iocasae TaxID=3098914 RepID=UPI0035D489FA
MHFKEVKPTDLPIALLLEADPSKTCIQSYLERSLCFAAFENEQLVGACVTHSQATDSEETDHTEIFNIAVWPEFQGKGIGTALLKHVIEQLKKYGYKTVELGTGTFGYQLTYYQRLGFRVEGVRKNFFIEHYEEPIYEHGLQHIDMLRLALKLR